MLKFSPKLSEWREAPLNEAQRAEVLSFMEGYVDNVSDNARKLLYYSLYMSLGYPTVKGSTGKNLKSLYWITCSTNGSDKGGKDFIDLSASFLDGITLDYLAVREVSDKDKVHLHALCVSPLLNEKGSYVNYGKKFKTSLSKSFPRVKKDGMYLLDQSVNDELAHLHVKKVSNFSGLMACVLYMMKRDKQECKYMFVRGDYRHFYSIIQPPTRYIDMLDESDDE